MSDPEVYGKVPENPGLIPAISSSLDDLSDYTDAEESLSAPTEILTEFLHFIMKKDYEMALKYCTLILKYEPNNTTAIEFQPLILEKLEIMKDEEDDSESESSESLLSSSSSAESLEEKTQSSGATSASYSNLVDDDDVIDNTAFQIADNGNTIDDPLLEPPNNNPKEQNQEDKNTKTCIPKPRPPPPKPNILVHPSPTRTLAAIKSPLPLPKLIRAKEKEEHKMTASSPARILVHPTPTTTFGSRTQTIEMKKKLNKTRNEKETTRNNQTKTNGLKNCQTRKVSKPNYLSKRITQK